MSKFKVGDLVRVTKNAGTHFFNVGDLAVITTVGERDDYRAYREEEDLGQWLEADEIKLLGTTIGGKVGSQLTKAEYLAFIEKTFAEMTTLIKAKNSDYTAGSDDPFANFRQSVDYGVDPLSGLMVRVGDKLQRIKSFTKAGKLEVANEGVEDAFKDLIGYSLIALGMLSERAK